MNYYCSTCEKSLCSDCAMFGKEHKEHSFERLGEVYSKHLTDIREAEKVLKKRLEMYNGQMEDFEHTISKLQNAKEEKTTEARMIIDQICARLETQHKERLMALLAQKGVMADEIDYLESLHADINKEISKTSKSSLVSRSKELIKTLNTIQERSPTVFISANVDTGFQ